MAKRRTAVAAALVAMAVTACTSGQARPPGPVRTTPVASGQGIGDPYYSDDGNLGYDVAGYDVQVRYAPGDQSVVARTTIDATATQRLTQVHFDLLGLTVDGVDVDGAAASFDRTDAHELVITPAKPVTAGADFVTVVRYHGAPGIDRVGQVASGWYDATTPGGGFIAGEPHSCSLWYPCNDHPTDKATFHLTATVPRPFAVVSVGVQGKTTPGKLADGTRVRTYRWRLDVPTATYLTTIYIDQLTFERSRLADGTPVVSAYGPSPDAAPAREAKLPEILDVLSQAWGPYPAPTAGGIFVNGQVPFSLETFGRPIYTEGAEVSTIVHENGHQWWGDNVSIERWRDICLNECFASYSSWLWDEHRGVDLDERYRRIVAHDSGLFDAPLYDMGPGHEFDGPGVYYKGTFFLHALRRLLGDEPFFSALQGIQRDHAGGNLSMTGLRDELEQRTGVDLTGFWQDWVFTTNVPSDANLHPATL